MCALVLSIPPCRLPRRCHVVVRAVTQGAARLRVCAKRVDVTGVLFGGRDAYAASHTSTGGAAVDGPV